MADWADEKAAYMTQPQVIGLAALFRQVRIDALEEAARLIEGWPDPGSQPSVILAVESCAHAIRRLKDKQP